jgi:hypothetical protein
MAHDLATAGALASRYSLRPVDHGYLLPVRSSLHLVAPAPRKDKVSIALARKSNLLTSISKITAQSVS